MFHDTTPTIPLLPPGTLPLSLLVFFKSREKAQVLGGILSEMPTAPTLRGRAGGQAGGQARNGRSQASSARKSGREAVAYARSWAVSDRWPAAGGVQRGGLRRGARARHAKSKNTPCASSARRPARGNQRASCVDEPARGSGARAGRFRTLVDRREHSARGVARAPRE